MNEVKLITKDGLKEQAYERMRKGVNVSGAEMCNIVTPALGSKTGIISDEATFRAVMRSEQVGREDARSGDLVKKYGSAWDVPRFFKSNGSEMSTREAIKKGIFGNGKDVKMVNSFIPDWQNLWDALRIDISVRKAAMDTIRQEFYNIIDMPGSDKIFKSTEFYPYGVIFEENNGEGQAVRQGESRAGAFEDIEHLIYAAGFTWTLLAELFDKSIDPEKISDAVMVGYVAKRDDLSIAPILNFNYAGLPVSQTAAAALSGATRQELLYLTLENAIDALAEREDPITDRKIDATDLRILASPYDARHIARVASGLPSVNERSYPGLSAISRVVAYDGETIPLRAGNVVYPGVTNGTAYLVKRNRYLNVGVKRNLTLEVDQRPDVTTLAREQRSWYFVEGQQTTGIQWFVQEITLPAW